MKKNKPALTLTIPPKTPLETFIAGSNTQDKPNDSGALSPANVDETTVIAVSSTNAEETSRKDYLEGDTDQDLVERKTGFILRLNPEQMREIELVLKESKYKSKQKMGEAMLMDGVKALKIELGLP